MLKKLDFLDNLLQENGFIFDSDLQRCIFEYICVFSVIKLKRIHLSFEEFQSFYEEDKIIEKQWYASIKGLRDIEYRRDYKFFSEFKCNKDGTFHIKPNDESLFNEIRYYGTRHLYIKYSSDIDDIKEKAKEELFLAYPSVRRAYEIELSQDKVIFYSVLTKIVERFNVSEKEVADSIVEAMRLGNEMKFLIDRADEHWTMEKHVGHIYEIWFRSYADSILADLR